MLSYIILTVVSKLHDNYTGGEFSNSLALIVLRFKVAARLFCLVQHSVVLHGVGSCAVQVQYVLNQFFESQN